MNQDKIDRPLEAINLQIARDKAALEFGWGLWINIEMNLLQVANISSIVDRAMELYAESSLSQEKAKAFDEGVNSAINTLGFSSAVYIYPQDYTIMSNWMKQTTNPYTPKDLTLKK